MRRVVLDTNVWVSAFLYGGKPAELIHLAFRNEILVVTSPALKAELERVLIEKFRFPRVIVESILAELSALSSLSYPAEKLSVVIDDPADDRVLECAANAKADAIVSGDKHLLNIKIFRGIPILSPNDFLSEWDRKKQH